LNSKILAIHLFLLLIFVSCSSNLNAPSSNSIKHLKYYAGISVSSKKSDWTDAGIKLEAGDNLLIMAFGRVKLRSWPKSMGPTEALKVKIGDTDPVMCRAKFYETISKPAKLHFMVPDTHYKDNSGSFRIDIFVIAKEDEIYLSDILTEFLLKNPDDKELQSRRL
jgi:hypothetical protein